MQIIPAIDLKNGRCVRLTEGRADSVKVYDRDPVEVARAYGLAGARLIHVVDLDGAFLHAATGNQEIIRRIAAEAGVPLQVGGGVRSLADMTTMLRVTGAKYVIVGTLAVEEPGVLAQAIAEFGEQVIVGIDARGSEVATRGWTDATQVNAFDLARAVGNAGVKRVIYTDITRDGRLEGPNIEMTGELARRSGLKITASGGVSSLGDISRLCELEADGVDSVILGKALYEGRFTLEEAIAATV
ncbi:MAG: 1-(5-phosphoribosyl)-5-[(5-phosphoribosylamino)methylideneamino]imidazole-4-carboxamide isomerase [Acidobacteriota bacterium]